MSICLYSWTVYCIAGLLSEHCNLFRISECLLNYSACPHIVLLLSLSVDQSMYCLFCYFLFAFLYLINKSFQNFLFPLSSLLFLFFSFYLTFSSQSAILLLSFFQFLFCYFYLIHVL